MLDQGKIVISIARQLHRPVFHKPLQFNFKCKTSYLQSIRALCANKERDKNEDDPQTSLSNNDNRSSDSCKKGSLEQLLIEAVGYISEDLKDSWATSPYPQGAITRRDQALKYPRPRRDPRETSVILFPGQGSQFVGMGKDLLKFPFTRDLFEAANEILGYNLLKLCLNGPKNELDKNIYCQPAILVSSLAAVERLRDERPAAIENCVATAGFSVGEIAALVFAGALPFERAVKLVKVRAEAMQIASEMVPGGMMAVFYSPDSQLTFACLRAKEWCLERGIESPQCTIANYLAPHCKVIAGHTEALKFIESNAAHFKLKHYKILPISGAFHSDLMRPAVKPFKEALKKMDVADPLISVHSNVDGKTYRNSNHVRRQLPWQICKPVKWEQTLHILYERASGEYFPRTFECGPDCSPTAQHLSARWSTASLEHPCMHCSEQHFPESLDGMWWTGTIPSRSPDIMPLVFFSGYVKDKTYSTKVPDIAALHRRIVEAIATIGADML